MSAQAVASFSVQSIFQPFDFKPLKDWTSEKTQTLKAFTATALNKHTDLISSVGILAISTCLLASKIFDAIPKILPRLSLVVFNYGGIIWLNVQVRDLLKSCNDLVYGIKHKHWSQVVETAAKVFYKGVNVLLTCAFFGSSVLAVVGFPGAVLSVALAVRPLSLVSLALNICSDLRDYFINEAILREVEKIETGADARNKIGSMMIQFLERIKGVKSTGESTQETFLADKVIYQLDTQTLETFQEKISGRVVEGNHRVEAMKIFFAVQDGIRSRQAGTRASLSLTIMGYLSMGLSKMFPDSLTEMASRWSMSVLYTDDLVRHKLSQMNISGQLA